MILEGRIEYKKALILTPERIKELETILLKYCDRIDYEATTVAETEISFSSVEELLAYDNFQNRRLKSLNMIGRDGLSRVVTCMFGPDRLKFFVSYAETCICRYTVSNVDTETTLREGILTFLRKCTAQFWLVGKFSLFGLLGCISLYAFLPIMLVFGKNDTSKITIPGAIVAILLGYCFVSITRLFDKCFLEKIFPPIVFLWGEEQSRFERNDGTRKNIFWCFLVAIIAGIIVFYITNQLPK